MSMSSPAEQHRLSPAYGTAIMHPAEQLRLPLPYGVIQRCLAATDGYDEKFSQSNPVWGWFGPAYKAPRFQSGPGEMWILNFDWPLGWEAVSGEMR